jgi:hypothetical protein
MTRIVHEPDQIRQIRRAAQALADFAEALEEARARGVSTLRRERAFAQAARDLAALAPFAALAASRECAVCESVAVDALCAACLDRYRTLSRVEWPEVSAQDRRWYDAADRALQDARRGAR